MKERQNKQAQKNTFVSQQTSHLQIVHSAKDNPTISFQTQSFVGRSSKNRGLIQKVGIW